MMRLIPLEIFIGWLILASVWAFVLFGIDKWRAARNSAHRISEFTLLFLCALGGWCGGLLGIAVFRHKSAKLSFLLQFSGAFLVFAALLGGAWMFLGR